MIVGYLHIGPRQHGTHRYGRLLASEVATRPGIQVIETSVELGPDQRNHVELIEHAALELADCDVVHIQYGLWDNASLWGSGWTQLRNLRVFARSCRVPIVATVHDVYPFYIARSFVRRRRGPSDPPDLGSARDDKATPGWFRATLERLRRVPSVDIANWWTLRWLSRRARFLFFLSREEARRVRSRAVRKKTRVIHHFIERRAPAVSAGAAREICGADGKKTVTLMGYIHNGKGHALLIDAMRHLPEDVRVVFAGGPSPGAEPFLEMLLGRARSYGVDQRLTVTGFLPEDELEPWMLATDLAVCPFRLLSASSSLAGWISLGRPVLASRLPQIDELNAVSPGAIHTFAPYRADIFAREIRRLLPGSDGEPDAGSTDLRERLSIPIVAQKHADVYAEASAMTITMAPWYPTNPYQQLLASALGDLGAPVTLVPLRRFSRPGSALRLACDVFHLHWIQGFVVAQNRVLAALKLVVLAANLAWLRLRRTRLVWTIHELNDHDLRNSRLDAMANRIAAWACQAFITHCPRARDEAIARLGLEPARVHVIPMGPYTNAYPSATSRGDARRLLGLPDDALVFLFVGILKRYKGVTELAAAFSRLPHRDLRLVIVGDLRDERLEDEIRRAIDGDQRISLHTGFVSDRRMGTFLSACDCTVFPYRRVMSSSSIHLSASWGRPSVAPRVGCVADDLDESNSFLYDPQSEDALYGALCDVIARRHDLDDMGARQRSREMSLSWEKIARRTLTVYWSPDS